MKISAEEKFSLYEYVFFKMRGYPWWPGNIVNIDNSSKKQIYSIVDSSTNTISKISDNKNIIKFEENIEHVAQNAKGKKYINSLILGIENFFEGKTIPKKYEKIIKDLKEGKNNGYEKNKENINNEEYVDENKNNINNKNKEEKIITKENKKIKKKEKEIKMDTKNNSLLNKKRKTPNPNIKNENEDLNNKKENKIKKTENKPKIPETKKEKEKESPNKKIKLEGLESLKEHIREKEMREKEKQKENTSSKKSKEEKENIEENEEIESESSSTSEIKENNLMIKNYKNFDFYQIVKYLKRFSEYLHKNQKEGKNSYFTVEDKKNFINLMEYLNNKEMNDTIQFLKVTNIGNYINYINERTKVKEFKELTQKFLENNSSKIQLQVFVENTLDIKDI